MASSTINKRPPCASCTGKISTGIFTCGGCSQAFCMRHVSEHKQALAGQMDELVHNHDQFKQTLVEQTTQPQGHSLMAKIDEWERLSIDKIRQTADHARQQLEGTVQEHTKHISQAFKQLTEQLNKARVDDDYVETDLKQWSEELDKLKTQLAAPSNFTIREERQSSTPFISNLSIHISGTENDVFENTLGDLRIEDNGQVVVHGSSNAHAPVRGKVEYRSGQHKLRFKIESYASGQWIFLGIVSGTTPVEGYSWAWITPSLCGWAGQTYVVLSGVNQSGFNGYKCDFAENDTIELFLDCDHRLIRLTNERTKGFHVMAVDLAQCPFPWHFHLNLRDAHDRVRILPSD